MVSNNDKKIMSKPNNMLCHQQTVLFGLDYLDPQIHSEAENYQFVEYYKNVCWRLLMLSFNMIELINLYHKLYNNNVHFGLINNYIPSPFLCVLWPNVPHLFVVAWRHHITSCFSLLSFNNCYKFVYFWHGFWKIMGYCLSFYWIKRM